MKSDEELNVIGDGDENGMWCSTTLQGAMNLYLHIVLLLRLENLNAFHMACSASVGI